MRFGAIIQRQFAPFCYLLLLPLPTILTGPSRLSMGSTDTYNMQQRNTAHRLLIRTGTTIGTIYEQ